MRRTATITLYWLAFGLLVLLIAGGPVPVAAGALASTGLAMAALALVGGFTLWDLTNGTRAGPALSALSFHVLAASALPVMPALFHRWRHTAPGNGALRRITPKALHPMP